MSGLTYPYFSKPFELKPDASFSGLGAVLTQWDENGYSMVIAYASHYLGPNEKAMWNNKIGITGTQTGHNWETEKFLLGSHFTVLTGNNPLAYIKESMQGQLKFIGSASWPFSILISNIKVGSLTG